ncbi:MAG: hypothetical protein HN742_08275 [Lentisphaerae bacterium]|jgi:hypothetical protein|nr:hypothetical protein [Lentisphaerota bacterium]MBT4817047.1 hypothetical protein [Lentisphaerota bacterium]MBT5610397.1 hypothetical protein [Lentisphaerota bacterium]MBT7056225.1 hypothetical protein [Lentisphaerota bacterium]MBT7841853.1 hypothetical protein [Lentisphaerota bacterium]
MKAIVTATSAPSSHEQSPPRWPPPLLTVLDRPFLQHVVEYLAAQGITDIEFILCEEAQRLRQFLENGTRWGCSFGFHLARDPEQPYARCRSLSWADPSELILLADAGCLPCSDLRSLKPSGPHVVPISAPPSGDAWTGWAWLPAHAFAALPCEASRKEFGEALAVMASSETDTSTATCETLLSTETPAHYLGTVRDILDGQMGTLMHGGFEADAGIWLSRNVSLHPTVALRPPVYIAANCRIGPGVRLGPHAVVGEGCVIERKSSVINSTVLPKSFVGEGLELHHCVVDRNRLISASAGVAVPVEDFLLGSLADRDLRHAVNTAVSRLTGCVAALLALPFVLVAAVILKPMRRGPLLFRRTALKLPAPPDPMHWKTFTQYSFIPFADDSAAPEAQSGGGILGTLLYLLPGVFSIAAGHLHFVGVPPRDPEAVEKLPGDWRDLYLHAKAGLVTETGVLYGQTPDDDERYSAEVMYAATAGFRHDLRLMLAYCISCLTR